MWLGALSRSQPSVADIRAIADPNAAPTEASYMAGYQRYNNKEMIAVTHGDHQVRDSLREPGCNPRAAGAHFGARYDGGRPIYGSEAWGVAHRGSSVSGRAVGHRGG